MREGPDMTNLEEWSRFLEGQRRILKPSEQDIAEMSGLHDRARHYLEFYNWCLEIRETYVGLMQPGIIAIFLFRIRPGRDDVDEWLWVVVGDLPSAYLVTDVCPTTRAALDGYIGEMQAWVDAARKGKSVANLIPVNVPTTKEWAEKLDKRLGFLDERIMPLLDDDLIA